MRYQELLEDELLEGKTFEIPSFSGEIRVWEDPGEPQLHALQRKFGELRGVTFPDGRYWVWQAYQATHQDVRQPNKLDTDAHFYVGGENPQDSTWTMGTWAFKNSGLTMWIDRQKLPVRLQAIFREPAGFTPMPG